MDTIVASEPRLERGFSLAEHAEELWWELPWWVRSPAFLGTVWLTIAASFLIAFCLVVNGVVERSQVRQWDVAEQARQEWLCASARGRVETDCRPVQVSRSP
jgi:heme exporter protein D